VRNFSTVGSLSRRAPRARSGVPPRGSRRTSRGRRTRPLDKDRTLVARDGLAADADPKQAAAFHRAAKAGRVQDGLLIEAGLTALESGHAVGVFVHEEQGMVRNVPRVEPMLAEQIRRQVRRAKRSHQVASIGPRAEGKPWQHRLGHPACREILPTPGGVGMVREQRVLQAARQDGKRGRCWRERRRVASAVQGDPRPVREHGERGPECLALRLGELPLTFENKADPGPAVSAREAVTESPASRHGERGMPIGMGATRAAGDPTAGGPAEGHQREQSTGIPDIWMLEALHDGAPGQRPTAEHRVTAGLAARSMRLWGLRPSVGRGDDRSARGPGHRSRSGSRMRGTRGPTVDRDG
jgi:hypothetical protein